MTEPTRRVTISFTIPSRLHLAIGAALAAVTIAAFWVHFALPADHAYKITTSSVGNLVGCIAAVYMAWCTVQRNRSDTTELTDVTKAAIEAAAIRQEGIRSTVEAATTATLLALREIAETLAEHHGTLKELHEAVTLTADAVEALADAVEALQDCYLEQGRVLVLPAREDAPHDQMLGAR